ncbi:MAG: glycoside hydrolase family 3 N-terminal domain-containing protein [Cyanobacteria bacterium P01_E01_bin.6]
MNHRYFSSFFFKLVFLAFVAGIFLSTLVPTIMPTSSSHVFRNNPSPPPQVDTLLTQMTLVEKIGQMTLVAKRTIDNEKDIRDLGIGGMLSGGGGYPDPNTPESWADMVDGFQAKALDSRLGIPLIYGVDAVHGHNNMYGAVIFPHNIGLGAANNPELLTRIGHVTASEMAATGIYWNYAPVVALPKDIRWGRTYEAYSDDPEKVSSLAVALMQGLQGNDLRDPATVLATPKHFIGDGATIFGTAARSGFLLDQGDAQMDEETLRKRHLVPYEAVIQSGAKSIMASYNSWNGTKLHGHRYLLTTVLKEELGFSGFVVSDWDAIQQIAPDDYYTSVVTAINAGIDMNMMSSHYKRFIDTLTRAVQAGDVSMERIDDAVRRILTVKVELGLFEAPFANRVLLDQVGSVAHREVAREAVSQSLVVLKNEDDLLPLSKQLRRIYVAGDGAHDIGLQSGGWTIEWNGDRGAIAPGTTLLEGIQQTVSPDTLVTYAADGQFSASDDPADVCIVAVSEEPYAEGKGDRHDLFLSEADQQLLNTVKSSCQKMIVIIISGRPLIITEFVDEWDALVAAWLPGTEGAGVADVLFGDRPFTGRLPLNWPRSMAQIPTQTMASGSQNDSTPLFPQGFGLVK